MKKNKDENIKFASPLRYPGGKTLLANFISQAIDKNFPENEKITLVEPYAGGAGASLKLLFSGKIHKVIINDLDRAIYSFWKVAVCDTDFLINKVIAVKVNMEEWRKQKKIYNDPLSKMNDLAFATLFLNRTNHSGIIQGGPIGGIKQLGVWNINARFTKSTIIKRLEYIKKYKDKIKVYCIDGIELLKILEKSKNIGKYFVFLDPPYYQKGKFLYLNHYNDKEHKDLSNFLENSTLKWTMTYDDVSYINNLYNKMQKSKFILNHSAYKSKKGREVLIFANNVIPIAVN